VVVVLGGVYFTRTGHAPAGQLPLVEMNTSALSALQSEFNRTSADLRVILLLSPTWPVCLRGSSAVEKILNNHRASSVVVFAVWEPILPTDWSAPDTSVLDRLNDRRVRQFWDPGHVLAAYAPGARWSDILPEPVLLNGPIVQNADALESIVAKAK
jgi:hypothetical protein